MPKRPFFKRKDLGESPSLDSYMNLTKDAANIFYYRWIIQTAVPDSLYLTAKIFCHETLRHYVFENLTQLQIDPCLR